MGVERFVVQRNPGNPLGQRVMDANFPALEELAIAINAEPQGSEAQAAMVARLQAFDRVVGEWVKAGAKDPVPLLDAGVS